jgi:hypothetical protein
VLERIATVENNLTLTVEFNRLGGLINAIITSQDGSVLNFLDLNFKVLIKHIFDMSDAHLINLVQRSRFFVEVKLIGLHTGLGNQATKSLGNHSRILIQIMDLVIK